MDLTDFIKSCISYDAVGSRVTCNPAPVGTDEDFLAYVTNMGAACKAMQDLGFVTTTDSEYEGMSESNFVSWRRGDTNIIVTPDGSFVDAFLAASHIAKRLNLLNKPDRIALFQAVLYRRQWTEEPSVELIELDAPASPEEVVA